MTEPAMIVSLDFELFWGMQDKCDLSSYKDNVLGVRKAIPLMLDLFEKYGIHATWATVGFLFGENENELKQFFPENLPTYENNKVSAYRCFGNIGTDEISAPCYYGYSMLSKIKEVSGQEIASHTFSHYYCREKGQTVEQFRDDMLAAKKIAEKKGYSLKSVVLPRNQCQEDYIAVLSELGFIAYRDEENDWIHEKVKISFLKRILRLIDVYIPLTGKGGYIPSVEHGIVNLVGSRMYKPFFRPLFFAEKLKVNRIKKQMLHAAENGKTFHLWWHPHNVGVYTEFHLKQLEEIFKYYTELNKKFNMCSLNMEEAAQRVMNGVL